MTVSWGNVERFDERAGIRRVAAAAPGAALGDGPGRPFPGQMRAGTALWEIKAGAHDQAS